MLHTLSLIYLALGALVSIGYWADPAMRNRSVSIREVVLFTILIVLFWPIGLLEIRDGLRR